VNSDPADTAIGRTQAVSTHPSAHGVAGAQWVHPSAPTTHCSALLPDTHWLSPEVQASAQQAAPPQAHVVVAVT
jgi:hypothetical protein